MSASKSSVEAQNEWKRCFFSVSDAGEKSDEVLRLLLFENWDRSKTSD